MKKPNIVFYFADQQRADTLGCMGQPLQVTPVLDELASKGTLFTNAYTCQPVCGPARACLQTGRYATQVGCHINGISPPFGEVKMLAEHFNEAGYHTAYVGKWHLATDAFKGLNYETTAIPQSRRGGYKDYWRAADVLEFTSHGYNGFVFNDANEKVEFTGYRADCINNFAIDFVRSQKSDEPFFLFVSQIEPHHQNDHGCFEGPDGCRAKFGKFATPGDLVQTKGDWQESYPDYLGCCNSLDYNVGRLVDSLKEKGLWDNTILFYTADHGSHFRTRNSEYKRSCHDSSIHIPLVAVGGCFDGKGKIDKVVSLIDLPVTLLSLAGISKPDDFVGRDLTTLAIDSQPVWEDVAFIQISESQTGRAIRTNRYTYSVKGDCSNTSDHANTYHEEFLYDNFLDEHQRNNLIADSSMAKIRKELCDILRQKMAQAGESPSSIESVII